MKTIFYESYDIDYVSEFRECSIRDALMEWIITYGDGPALIRDREYFGSSLLDELHWRFAPPIRHGANAVTKEQSKCLVIVVGTSATESGKIMQLSEAGKQLLNLIKEN